MVDTATKTKLLMQKLQMADGRNAEYVNKELQNIIDRLQLPLTKEKLEAEEDVTADTATASSEKLKESTKTSKKDKTDAVQLFPATDVLSLIQENIKLKQEDLNQYIEFAKR